MRLPRLMPDARTFAIVIGLTLLAPTVARAASDTTTVKATGEAAIVDGDKAQAKDRATKDALRNAVEQALGTYIVSESQTKDFALIKDQILTAAEGYVSSYDVIGEKDEGNAYAVTIKAKVAKAHIEKDAAARGLVLQAMKFPRMAVLIAEQHIGQTQPAVWWGPQGHGTTPGQIVTVDERLVENEVIGEWTQAGFDFVDMEALSGKLKLARVVSTNPTADEVRQISNLSDADVIIVGTAVATEQGDLMKTFGDGSSDNGGLPFLSCKGSISARVFDSDSGEILATSEASKTATGISTMACNRQALLETAKAFAADMQAKVLQSWNKRLMGGSRVRMIVKGVHSFHLLRKFESLLKGKIRNVESVDEKSFHNGKADLDLRVSGGDAQALADDLDSKKMGGATVSVTDVTQNTISVELSK